MNYSDCELPSFYDVRVHKAKKRYSCCECSSSIDIGETYTYCIGKWAGELNVYRQHNLCADACRYVRDELSDGECIGFGCLKEWYHDCPLDQKTEPKIFQIRKIISQILRRERLYKIKGENHK